MCFERSVIASENNEGCIWLFCYAIIATWNLALPRVAARQLQLYYSVVRLSVETSQTFVRCAAVYWAVFELVTRYLIFRMFNKLGQVRSGQVRSGRRLTVTFVGCVYTLARCVQLTWRHSMTAAADDQSSRLIHLILPNCYWMIHQTAPPPVEH